MKFILQLFAITLTAFILESFLPWYSVALAAFIFGYILKSKANFLAGFLAIALLWLIKIAMIESVSSSDLAERVAQIFPLQEKYLLILITVVLGGLTGGFAALTGSLLKPSKKKSYYY